MSEARQVDKRKLRHVNCLRIEGLVPGWIEPTYTTGKVRAIPILGLYVVRIL